MIVQVENCKVKFFLLVLSCCSLLLAVVQASDECVICTKNTQLVRITYYVLLIQLNLKYRNIKINNLY